MIKWKRVEETLTKEKIFTNRSDNGVLAKMCKFYKLTYNMEYGVTSLILKGRQQISLVRMKSHKCQ